MKITKIAIRPKKIRIDLVLCPKTLLYLQDLYCRRCSYFEESSDEFIECTFSGHRYGKSDPVKDRIIKDLSKSFITELPSNNNKLEVEHFAKRLESSRVQNTDKELLKNDLSQYMRKTNLTTRLESIKKVTLKEE